MKSIFFTILLISVTSCNFSMSDSSESLPNGYLFSKEGGHLNRIARNNEMIVDSGAVDFSYDDNFILFSVDTTYSNNPEKVSKQSLKYYAHSRLKDTLSKPMDYIHFQRFVKFHKIDSENDISNQH